MRYRISKALDDKQDANESEVSSSFPQLLFYPFFLLTASNTFPPRLAKQQKKTVTTWLNTQYDVILPCLL